MADITQSLLIGRPLSAVQERLTLLCQAHPEFIPESWDGISRSYIVDTWHTVFDALLNSTSFEGCLTRVVNRGGDADTAGAIAGQLAGAYFGIQGLPPRWIRHLDHPVMATIRNQVVSLVALSPFARTNPVKARVPENKSTLRRSWY